MIVVRLPIKCQTPLTSRAYALGRGQCSQQRSKGSLCSLRSLPSSIGHAATGIVRYFVVVLSLSTTDMFSNISNTQARYPNLRFVAMILDPQLLLLDSLVSSERSDATGVIIEIKMLRTCKDRELAMVSQSITN